MLVTHAQGRTAGLARQGEVCFLVRHKDIWVAAEESVIKIRVGHRAELRLELVQCAGGVVEMVGGVVHFPPVAALDTPTLCAGKVQIGIIGFVVNIICFGTSAQSIRLYSRQFTAKAKRRFGIVVQIQFRAQLQKRLENGGRHNTKACFVALGKLYISGPGFLGVQRTPKYRQIKYGKSVQAQYGISAKHALLRRNR